MERRREGKRGEVGRKEGGRGKGKGGEGRGVRWGVREREKEEGLSDSTRNMRQFKN